MKKSAFHENYFNDALATFRSYKLMAEKAMEQISDEEFFHQIDSESNSIAVMVKHISGNQRSRWTNFFESDGEKPDRCRDTEFEVESGPRDLLMTGWELGWNILFEAVKSLSAADSKKSVTIRGESYTIIEAVNRQLTHYAYHIGQIVFLAKHFRSSEWKTLSVPKNRSGKFTEYLKSRTTEGQKKFNAIDGAMKFADKETDRNSN